MARYMRSYGKSRLGQPVVVAEPVPFVAAPVAVTLSPSSLLSRAAHYRLRPPAVVGAGIAWHGPGNYLTRPKSPPPVHSRLQPPAVVAAVVVEAYYGPQTWLAYSRRGNAKSTLSEPQVLHDTFEDCAFVTDDFNRANEDPLGGIWGPADAKIVGNQFVPSTADPSSGYAVLRQKIPTDVQASFQYINATDGSIGIHFGDPNELNPTAILNFIAQAITLTNTGFVGFNWTKSTTVSAGDYIGFRRFGTTYEVWHKPISTGVWVFIGQGIDNDVHDQIGISISSDGAAVADNFSVCPLLEEPVSVSLAVRDRVARNFRKTTSNLLPPVVVTQQVNYGPQVGLAPSHSRSRRSWYRSIVPAVIGQGIVHKPLRLELTYSRRGIAKSILVPPAVVTPFAQQIYYGPEVNLVDGPQRKVIAKSQLQPPTAVDPKSFRGLAIKLTTPSDGYRRAQVVTYALKTPVVIGAGIVYPPLRIKLIPLAPRGAPYSRLAPPAVVAQAVTYAAEVRTSLAYSRRGRAIYELRSPTVVRPFFPYGIRVSLVPSHGGVVHYRLSPPAVVNPFFVYGARVSLAPSSRGLPKSTLSAPIVVSPFFVYGARTSLAPSSRGLAKSQLSAPAVVTADTRVYAGPKVELAPSPSRPARAARSTLSAPARTEVSALGQIGIQLAPSKRGRVLSDLYPPTVIGAVQGPQGGILVQLAPRPRAVTTSFLRPPIFGVEEADVFFGPGIKLVTPSETYRRLQALSSDLAAPIVVRPADGVGFLAAVLAPSRRPTPKSILGPPAVVTPAAVTYAIQTTLAASRRGKTVYDLAGPAVVIARGDFGGIRLTFAPQRRPITKSILRPPAVVTAVVQVFYGVQPTLAPSRRPFARYVLQPPTVVFLAVEIYGPETSLTRITPPPVVYKLAPPRVVFLAVEVYGPEVALTRITPPPVESRLAPPVVVFEAVELSGPEVTLTRIPPPPTMARLQPPTVVTFEAFYGPSITLAPQPKPQGTARLIPPAVVGEVVYFGPVATLAASFRGAPKSVLSAPTVVDQPPPFLPPEQISLAPQARGIPKSRLFPPAVVGPGIHFGGPGRLLTYSVRKPGQARLEPPAVVLQAPTFFGPDVHLAPSFRGKPKPFLRPPVIPPLARPTQISLTYSLRGKPKSALKVPTVVFLAVEIFGPEITLAKIKPKPTTKYLFPPTDVKDREDIGFVRVTLARNKPKPTLALLKPPTRVLTFLEFGLLRVALTPSSRGKPKSRLQPPTVVAPFIARKTQIELTPSSRGKPKSDLKAPTVIFPPFVARPVKITLAQIVPPPTVSLLKPPTIIGAPERFFGPKVTLVRIKPAPTIQFVITGEILPFRPPHGDVCGFDIAGSFVCYVEVPGAAVSGEDRATGTVTGTSQSESKISGGDRATDAASGGDREAT